MAMNFSVWETSKIWWLLNLVKQLRCLYCFRQRRFSSGQEGSSSGGGSTGGGVAVVPATSDRLLQVPLAKQRVFGRIGV
jgi:hypothetical protein